jgi:hypothetical protein
VEPVVVDPAARLAAALDHPGLHEVAHRARDRGGGDRQPLGELARRQPPGVVGQDRCEHARGHARHPRLVEQQREVLDELGRRGPVFTIHKFVKHM